jgi:hypothetical protein
LYQDLLYKEEILIQEEELIEPDGEPGVLAGI